MAYSAYITRIKNLRKHTNADRLMVGECFGNFVIVGLDTTENELGVYFPTDGKLGLEYAKQNRLLREKDENGNQVGGYLDPEKRHVTTIKLRGEKSDGLFMPLKSLEGFCNIKDLREGDQITTLNGILICEKYIPRGGRSNIGPTKGKQKKKDSVSFPFFEEHVDTAQLVYNLQQFRPGDLCYLTLKMHGTSQRTAYTIKEEVKLLPKFIYKQLKFIGFEPKPKKNWEHVTGTRKVILKSFAQKGYYETNDFRKEWHDYIVGKLRKGEAIYYEVVGYEHDDKTIMPECSNAKTKDKEFIKQYGEVTRFTYGCGVGQSDVYVYRMTMTNEDGDVMEYPWYLVKLRAEQMGLKTVPEFERFIFTTEEDLMERVNKYVDGPDPVGKTHIREGVVVRIENRVKFTAYKHKNFNFKVLEGIIKSEDTIDMEESQEVVEGAN